MAALLHSPACCRQGGRTEFGLCAFLLFLLNHHLIVALNKLTLFNSLHIISMQNIFIPVWSRQHGAYITLITSWLIGTLLSEKLFPIHFVILVMLLAGFNCIEFIQDRFLRNSPPSQRNKLWTLIYLVLALTSGVCVIINVKEFKYLLPILMLAGLIFLLLTKLKLHKNVVSEFLSFAVFSISGLISFNPHHDTSFSNLFPLWLLMFLYFSSTIFLVKIRFERVKISGIVSYLAVSTALLFLVWGSVLIVWITVFLMILRLVPVIAVQEKFKAIKITKIGLIETGFQILFMAGVLIALK